LVVSEDWAAGYREGLRNGKAEADREVSRLIATIEEYAERIRTLERALEGELLSMHAEAVILELERLVRWIGKRRKKLEKKRDRLFDAKRFDAKMEAEARWWDAMCIQLSEVRNYVRCRMRKLRKLKGTKDAGDSS
jgi:hypothetical protein